MNRRILRAWLVASTVMTSLVTIHPAAHADHSTCGSGHVMGSTATGTVSDSNVDDWWTHTSSTARTFRLTMSGGDADLYVRDAGCVATLCSSTSGGTTTDSCTISTTGTVNVNVHRFTSGATIAYTLTVTAPHCADGVDNDADGRIDYPTDPGCTSTSDTSEVDPPPCSDGIDNDADGRTDYPADPGCTSSSDTTESPDPQCGDGVDNDGDGRTDYPADFGCSSLSDTTENPNPQCGDGIDNEGDGRIDYPADPGCTDSRDISEGSEPQCMDNLDNDADGRTDYPADFGCSSANDTSEAPNPQCADGLDNDADGRVDYPADTGCTDPRDNGEGVSCTTSSGVTACLGVSTGTEIQRIRVYSVNVVDGPEHTIAGYVEVYRFALPNSTSVNLPCIVLVQDGVRVDPCAEAGGSFVSQVATLVNETVAEPRVVQGPEVTNAGICNAELVATVNDVGLASSPTYTLC